MTKRPTLQRKQVVPQDQPQDTAPAAPAKRFPDRKQLTLYLSDEAYTQLRKLAAEQGVKMQDLMRDGVNKVFAEAGKPRIA